jgi:antitoxin HicB
MRSFTYRAHLEPGDIAGNVVVSFPDLPEVFTDGRGEAEALAEARDALEVALLAYARDGRPLPKARARTGRPVTVSAETAAKLAVLDAFHAAGISKTELARRLGRGENEARRILDPWHRTKLPMLEQAAAALGRRLVLGVEEIEPAA